MPPHVLEATLGIYSCSETGRVYHLTNTCIRPDPLAAGMTEYPEMVFDL